MNKLFLNQYFSIVLSLVFLVLFANNSYIAYLLFSLTAENPQVFSDTGFQLKFFETIFFAVMYASVSLYFALMTIMKFPLLEMGKETKSKKVETSEEEEK
jgi:hypothetical protein